MFAIATDTSSNLATPILEENQISVVPFTYIINGDAASCLDTRIFDGHAFYQAIRDGREVNTSQITPHVFLDAFRPILEAGQDLLFISMSSGISGSFNSCMTAIAELKEEFTDRTILAVDTLSASLAEGMAVLKAIELRAKGLTINEAYKFLDWYRHTICQVFTVDNLKHLLRTGRVSATAAKLGNMLAIKPILVGDKEGKIVPASFARGRNMSLKQVAEKFRLTAHEGPVDIYIAHADCSEEEINRFVDLLKQQHEVGNVMTVMYEPVTGAHVGPGTVALFYEGAEDARTELVKLHLFQTKPQNK